MLRNKISFKDRKVFHSKITILSENRHQLLQCHTLHCWSGSPTAAYADKARCLAANVVPLVEPRGIVETRNSGCRS